jgi:hypothetical protein
MGPWTLSQKLALAASQMEKSDDSRVAAADQDIRIASNTNMIAGSETTAISLTAIMYHMIKNPRVLEKQGAEIDHAATEVECRSQLCLINRNSCHTCKLSSKKVSRYILPRDIPCLEVVPKGGATLAAQLFPAGVRTLSYPMHLP